MHIVTGKSPADWADVYVPFLKTSAAGVFSSLLPDMPWIINGKKRFDYDVDELQEEDTVRANEDRFIFRLDSGTLKEFRQLDTTVQVQGRDKFGQAAYKVPIIITMCSATERSCMSVGEAKACAHLHIRAAQ